MEEEIFKLREKVEDLSIYIDMCSGWESVSDINSPIHLFPEDMFRIANTGTLNILVKIEFKDITLFSRRVDKFIDKLLGMSEYHKPDDIIKVVKPGERYYYKNGRRNFCRIIIANE